MIDLSLPRPHKVKQARVEYNSKIQLKTIPHCDGVYRSFEDTLKERIHNLVWQSIWVNIGIDGG